MSNAPTDDPARRAAEIDKLRAEIAKLAAEAKKLDFDAMKLDLEVDKLRNEARLRWRFLEFLKGLGTSAAVLAALVAAFTLMNTAWNDAAKRQVDERTRIDSEFGTALSDAADKDISRRLPGILRLRRFVGPGYESYHSRAVDALVYRLRLEDDAGARALIEAAAVSVGNGALASLRGVQRLAQIDLIPLFDPPAGKQTIPPEQEQRRRALQEGLLTASRAIATITKQRLDLSRALLAKSSLQHRELEDASLHEASLYAADFYHAKLARADLRKADLVDATFRGADLRDTDFSCAELTRADFRSARNVTPARMRHSNWRAARFDPADETALNRLYPLPEGTTHHRLETCAPRS
jgi:uncharacterized protein YjbI with pentapeptide repeats